MIFPWILVKKKKNLIFNIKYIILIFSFFLFFFFFFFSFVYLETKHFSRFNPDALAVNSSNFERKKKKKKKRNATSANANCKNSKL